MKEGQNMGSKEVYEAAIGFARMWGVKETLEPLPYLDCSQVRNMVMEWALEYVSSGKEDAVEFFKKKAAQVVCCQGNHLCKKGDILADCPGVGCGPVCECANADN